MYCRMKVTIEILFFLRFYALGLGSKLKHTDFHLLDFFPVFPVAKLQVHRRIQRVHVWPSVASTYPPNRIHKISA